MTNSISNYISIIASIITIVCAFISWNSYRKSKNLSIQLNKFNSLEKLSLQDKNIEKIRKLYLELKQIYSFKKFRGISSNQIINKYLEMETLFDTLKQEIPSIHKDIINPINSSILEINKIQNIRIFENNNENFQDLGIFISEIENGFKLEKEKIRGF